MRKAVVALFIALAVLTVAVTGFAGKPEIQAHGQLRTEISLAGVWFDVQIAFNVQDRGDRGDHGNLSMRIFHKEIGSLVAVGVSVGSMDVTESGGWVIITTPIRVAFYDDTYYLPLHYPVYTFQAFDGGSADEFVLMGRWVPILKGKIVIN